MESALKTSAAMQLPTLFSKIEELTKAFEQYSEGYHNLKKLANKKEAFIRQMKKERAKLAYAGFSTKFVDYCCRDVRVEAEQVRMRSLHFRQLRNKAQNELHELKFLMKKAGVDGV